MSDAPLLLLSDPGPALAVLRRDLDRARTEEGAGALLAAGALRELRELRPAPLMGVPNLGALLARELPEIDRRSLRTLLRIADAIAESPTPIELGALAAFGTARIAVIADAPAAERSGMVGAGVLPLAELLRRARAAREERDAAALRRNVAADRRRDPLVPLGSEPSGDHATTIERVRALIANARRGWSDAGVAVREQARLIAALLPARELAGGERKTLEENLRVHLSVDPREAATLARLDLAISFLPPKHVERAGIGTLRLAAAIDDEARRTALFDRLRREPLGADELLDLLAVERAPVARPKASGKGAARSESSEELLPLGLLLVASDAPEPRFADATEPELVEQLVLRASRPGDLVIDPMAGAGGVLTIARRLGRRAEGADILNPPFDPSISSADARTWSPSEPADLAIVHPPVPLEVIYSERYAGRTLAGDLSAMNEESFLAAMEGVLAQSLKTVRPGGTLALVAREGRGAGGRLIDWPGAIGTLAERAGLELVDRIYVPFSPARRRALLARDGFRARSSGRALPCVDIVSIYRTPEERTR
jgi:hypothetical protein